MQRANQSAQNDLLPLFNDVEHHFFSSLYLDVDHPSLDEKHLRTQIISLFAVSGANNVAVAVMIAHTIRYTDTGHVEPAQAISEAAMSGLKPPLSAAPNWKPSEAPL